MNQSREKESSTPLESRVARPSDLVVGAHFVKDALSAYIPRWPGIRNLISPRVAVPSAFSIAIAHSAVAPAFAQEVTAQVPDEPINRGAEESKKDNKTGPHESIIQKLITRSEKLSIDPNLDSKLEELDRVSGRYTERVNMINKAAEDSPQLQEQFKKMFPAFKQMGFKDLFPGYKVSAAVQRELMTIQRAFDRLAPQVEAGLLSPEEHDRAVTSLIRDIQSDIDVFGVRTGAEARETCNKMGMQVLLDPKIAPDPEGVVAFAHDKEKYTQLLNGLTDNNCTIIMLTSKNRYGPNESKSPLGEGPAAYTFRRDRDNQIIVGVIIVDPSKGSFTEQEIELLTTHEFAHSLFSTFENTFNLALADRLDPEDLVDVMARQIELLNSPEHGITVKTVPEMFSGFDNMPKNLNEFLTDTTPVSDEVLRALTNRYAVTVMTEPIRHLRTKDGEIVKANWISLLDSVALNSTAADKETRFAPLPRMKNPQVQYATFADFAADYVPLLEEQSELGNVRAKILLAGINEFGQYFDNYDHLIARDDTKTSNFTPKYDKSGPTWENYLNITLANAIMVHLALNGEIGGVDYRDLLTDQEPLALERDVSIRKYRAMGEANAEQVAFRSQLQLRLREDADPYLKQLIRTSRILRGELSAESVGDSNADEAGGRLILNIDQLIQPEIADENASLSNQ